MAERSLGSMTWTDVDGARPAPIVVVPVGSCEQHGPHLPIHTDTVVAEALARDLVDRRRDCVLAPAFAVTASGEHQGFPGTLSIGTEATTVIAVELARSADWAGGVVFVNGHGGNAVALARARDRLVGESRRVLVWTPHIAGGDLHAGRTETSLLLAIAPDDVRLDRAAAGPEPALADLVARGVRPLSPNGVLGDPTGASAAEGRTLLHRLGDQLAGAVAAWLDEAGS